MSTLVFSTRRFERPFLERAATATHTPLEFVDASLTAMTAPLAEGRHAVCCFVNDRLSRPTLEALVNGGTRLVALRCAGFNQVDIEAAADLGITVARVPAYSPHAVAEHTVALMMIVNRKLHRAWARVREGNFALDGLLGFDMHGRTVGLIGTGKIGRCTAAILKGFGCRLLAHDPHPHIEMTAMGAEYVGLDRLYAESDIISLHCPLTPDTHHLIDDQSLSQMKRGVMIVNTSRGAVVDTRALIAGLKSGRVGSVALDVYEEEADLFFRDLSDTVMQDDVFARLLTFPNVVITGHQAFFTQEALQNIADTTLTNIHRFTTDGTVPHANRVTPALVAK